jgi:hypothetical protein
VIRWLAGILRFEPNFGLFPFFLCLYKLVVGLVEATFGGSLVANEEAEGLGDAETVAHQFQVEEGFALVAETTSCPPASMGSFMSAFPCRYPNLLLPLTPAAKRNDRMGQHIIPDSDAERRSVDAGGSKVYASVYTRVHDLRESL